SKREALHEAIAAVAASAAAARADIGAIDDDGWVPPTRRPLPQRDDTFDAPDDTVERSLAFLAEHRGLLPAATFVFVLSDFLAPPPAAAWQDAVAHGWDVVPVVIQDPVWEASFPDVGGVAVPVADPRTGERASVRLSRREARRRRDEHERRRQALDDELASFGLDAVHVGDSDPALVDGAFIAWAEERRRRRWLH
ncbi:MAG: hypothetical protein ABUS54_11395, partial [Actinomycetota bacterium]